MLLPRIKFFQKWKEVWNQLPFLVFCITFEEKYFSCYILLVDPVSLSGCLYFMRYCGICVLQMLVNQLVESWILNLKWNSHLPKNYVICFIESRLKMMKKILYLNLKALFVLKIFKFLSQLFGHVGKTTWLER